MEIQDIIAQIDSQIAKLQQARALLADAAPTKRGPGRPAKGTASKPLPKGKPMPKGKRVLSAEARAKIAEAQKKRWSKTKRAAK